MSERNLIIVPFGGLANRVRVILSAISLAQKFNLKLKIYWIEREELNCSFKYLFERIINVEVISVKNNFFLKSLIKLASILSIDKSIIQNRLVTDKYIHSNFEQGYFDCNSSLFENRFAYSIKNNNIIVTCGKFYSYDTINLLTLQPALKIKQLINEFLEEYALINYSAFHIRYTDNLLSIQNSPLELFEEKIKFQIDCGNKVVICTDSEYVEEKFKLIFKDNVLFTNTSKDRNSIIGIQNAMFELYILSNATTIYGSFGSTFSLLASELKGGQLVLIKSVNKKI